MILLNLICTQSRSDIQVTAALCKSDEGRLFICSDQNATNQTMPSGESFYQTAIHNSTQPPDQDSGSFSSLMNRLLLYFHYPESGGPAQLQQATLIPVRSNENNTQEDQSGYWFHHQRHDGSNQLTMVSPVLSSGSSSKKALITPDLFALLPPVNSKQQYLDSTIRSVNNQLVMLYPVEITEQQQSSPYNAFYGELLLWAEQLAYKEATFNKAESRYVFAHTDEVLQQAIFSALAEAFDDMIEQQVPPEVALAVLTNNLVYNPDRQCISCPDCEDAASISCTGSVENQVQAISEYQHSEHCEYRQPNRCRIYDPSDQVQAKPKTCRCGQILSPNAIDTGGMAHLISGVRGLGRVCSQAVADLAEDLPDPHHICWVILGNVVNHTSHLYSILHQLVDHYGAETLLIWVNAAAQHNPSLNIIASQIQVMLDDAEEDNPPAASGDNHRQPNYMDQLMQYSDFWAQLPSGFSQQQGVAIANNIPQTGTYAEFCSLVLNAFQLLAQQPSQGATAFEPVTEELFQQFLLISDLPEEVLRQLLKRLTYINPHTLLPQTNPEPFIKTDDPRVFSDEWFSILAEFQEFPE